MSSAYSPELRDSILSTALAHLGYVSIATYISSAHRLSVKFGLQQDHQKQYLGIAVFTAQLRLGDGISGANMFVLQH